MNLLSSLLVLGASFCACPVQAKAVFAHFMITNTQNYTNSDWEDDIAKAQAAHIDAFALNIAHLDPVNDASIPAIFDMADSMGFQLFFSFDYAGGPVHSKAWPVSEVVSYLNQYQGRPSYYHYQGKAFVSTFEGPANAYDWPVIQSLTGEPYFIPDWSSLGAKEALLAGAGAIDGLFSWAAWPWGDHDMDTYVDASYLQYLNETNNGTSTPRLDYMMSASPWFYTNLPGYDKNWLWRGDDLWFDRWQEIWYVQPSFVEIISWNDYGESHYIGPVRPNAMAAFEIGRAPFNYALDMPHDGWRIFLPYVIDTYKNGIATITQEGLSAWFRPQYAAACSAANTTGNTCSQYQIEFPPTEVVQDYVFYSTLLTETAEVTVTIGGVSQAGNWRDTPDGGIGIYHGRVPFNGNVGAVVITLSRGGTTLATVSGGSVSKDCSATNGYENWNAWVGSSLATASVSATPTLKLENQVCIRGTGPNNFEGLCSWACQYGYCPVSACVCQAMGKQVPKPSATHPNGYPISGEDASYSGLCSFNCAHGYCPPSACNTVSVPLSTPTVSDFEPPACTAGEGPGNFAGLCSFACGHGFCPIQICTCTGQGALVLPPDPTNAPQDGYYLYGDDFGLCQFSCSHGYCPPQACSPGTDATVPGEVNIKPLPCTTVAASATFTMSAACTSGILNLPTGGPDASSQNDPPGEPAVCYEVCDFYRLLTGTCCGQGGTIGNPIEIPPSVTLPYDIPLPSGYIPKVNISIGVPGAYNPDIVYGNEFPGISVTTITYVTVTTSLSVSSYTTTDSSGHSITTHTSTPVTKSVTTSSTSRSCGLFPDGTPLETILSDIPLVRDITLPAGFCNPHPTPIVIPPIPLPDSDPPCYGQDCAPCQAGACGGGNSDGGSSDSPNPDDPSNPDDDPTNCSADPDPSSDTGLCSNGEFPFWDETTGDITCDMSAGDATIYISDCQVSADENYADTLEEIECQISECASKSKRTANCSPPSSWDDGKTGICDATFKCDTDLWPNVCNNARSAMDSKGAPSVLTYQGESVHATARYIKLHALGGDDRFEGGNPAQARDNGRRPPIQGWGLIGCQVEEYPFGNSIQRDKTAIAAYNDRPTLRLISQQENLNHATEMKKFLKYLKQQTSPNTNPTYCVEIIGSNQPADYCINADAACNNKCAAAYGPAFILVNDITKGDKNAAKKAGITNPQKWDKWFDEEPQRKQIHTLSYDPESLKKGITVPVTELAPPRFGSAPAPGLKTYVGNFPNGMWVLSYVVTAGSYSGTTRTVGTPAPRGPIDAKGQNLIYDNVPAQWFPSKRYWGAEGQESTNITLLGNNATIDYSKVWPWSARRSKRQLNGGSFLDAGVFVDVLECPILPDEFSCDDCGSDDTTQATSLAGDGADATYRLTATPSGPGATGPSYSPPPTTTSQPPPPPSATCILLGFDVTDLTGAGCGARGGCSSGSSKTGFELNYTSQVQIFEDDNDSGGTDPIAAGQWVTLSSSETHLPNDLQWYADYDLVDYQGCDVKYKGVEYPGTIDGSWCEQWDDSYACTACSVLFPCESGLA